MSTSHNLFNMNSKKCSKFTIKVLIDKFSASRKISSHIKRIIDCNVRANQNIGRSAQVTASERKRGMTRARVFERIFLLFSKRCLSILNLVTIVLKVLIYFRYWI